MKKCDIIKKIKNEHNKTRVVSPDNYVVFNQTPPND